jgi:hypothetical protein
MVIGRVEHRLQFTVNTLSQSHTIAQRRACALATSVFPVASNAGCPARDRLVQTVNVARPGAGRAQAQCVKLTLSVR